MTSLSALVLSGCSSSQPNAQPAPPSAPTALPQPTASGTQGEPVETSSWGPSKEQIERAHKFVAGMSVEDKAGTILVQTYRGTDTAQAQKTAQKLKLGGSIVMGDNVPIDSEGYINPGQFTDAVKNLKEAVPERPWGSILMVDQEGGTVARLRTPLTQWPTPMTFGAADDPKLTVDAATGMNAELAKWGFTFNNATVADTTIGAEDPTIGARSYGSDPQTVSTMVDASIEGAKKAGLVTSVKHFPGHGSVTSDSHVELPVQNSTLDQLRKRDWVPFQNAIKHGASSIMMGHINVPALEAGVPSSMSSASYAQLRSMGFEGVIVTDALNMGAITASYGPDQAPVTALKAGADLLLMPSDAQKAHAAIVQAVKKGVVSRQRIDDAAARVIALGLWQKSLSATRVAPREPGTGEDVARNASIKGTTVLTGQCKGAILPDKKVRVIGGDKGDREAFAKAAETAGITVGSQGPTLAFAAYGAKSAAADIVVATDGPWVLANSTARVKIASYSSTPPAFAALTAVLTGSAKPGGKLPTQVGQYPMGTGCANNE